MYSLICSNDGITYGKHQIPFPRHPGIAAGASESRVPFQTVSAEDKNQLCLFNEWLIVAGYAEPVPLFGITDTKDCIQLLIPGSGGLGGGFQDLLYDELPFS